MGAGSGGFMHRRWMSCPVVGAIAVSLVLVWGRSAEVSSENLLKNPGFEQGNADRPDYWHLSLVEMEGARAVWDAEVSHQGQRAVMLANEKRYPREQYNNWSQNVLGIAEGREITVSGYITSEKVTEAALWIQCWAKTKRELLGFATTATVFPVRGTADWSLREASLEVPEGTGIVTVRCVVSGTGTAWFDDIRLTEKVEPDESDEDNKELDEAEGLLIERLREANNILQESNKILTDTNRQLRYEIEELKRELAGLGRRKPADPPPGFPFLLSPDASNGKRN